MAWVTASTTALMLTFTITSYSGKILYIAWVMSTYFAITGLFVLIPAVCDHILGDKNAGILAGLVFILPSISGIFAALGVQFVYKCFGWFGSFCFIAFLSFIALITTLLYSETAMLPPC
ncbi:uncharacterized protein LOC106473467 [Limulus polyphemus]|uniref:Uncharacterized protein LOC106473467 n=1 Tax=Limulus polyphemus TaxID=6850 RepID=A0ABM1TNZ8_LIMPO|nr:uncharacterized protein LOC106473467 [Limulus polyphemus]